MMFGTGVGITKACKGLIDGTFADHRRFYRIRSPHLRIPGTSQGIVHCMSYMQTCVEPSVDFGTVQRMYSIVMYLQFLSELLCCCSFCMSSLSGASPSTLSCRASSAVWASLFSWVSIPGVHMSRRRGRMSTWLTCTPHPALQP